MRVRTLIAGLLAVRSLGPLGLAFAAGDPALLAKAIHDTNTVNTLQYSMVEIDHYSNGTVVQTLVQGREDEVGNREHDRETLTIQGKGKNGKRVTRGYAVDVIFVGGKTYYEYPFRDKTWHERSGMAFNDSIADFKRARTTVPIDKGVKLTSDGTTPGGDPRFLGHETKNGAKATVTAVVSKGTTPFVSALVIGGTSHDTQGHSVRFVRQFLFGPFNKPLNIVAPISST